MSRSACLCFFCCCWPWQPQSLGSGCSRNQLAILFLSYASTHVGSANLLHLQLKQTVKQINSALICSPSRPSNLQKRPSPTKLWSLKADVMLKSSSAAASCTFLPEAQHASPIQNECMVSIYCKCFEHTHAHLSVKEWSSEYKQGCVLDVQGTKWRK